MHTKRVLAVAVMCSCLAAAEFASAAPLTMNFNVGTGGPDTLSGTIGGTLKAQATSGSIIANFTDVDIDTNLLDFSNRTGNVTLAVNTATSVVNLNLPTTAFSSSLTGSLTGTADDGAYDVAPGTLGWLAPGTDGRWDDPNNTGSFNNASFGGASLTTTSNINIAATASGGINGTGTGGINLGSIPLLGTIWLQVLNTSTFSATFNPVQSVSVQNLALSTSGSFTTALPVSNFVEAAHPTGSTVLDLSVNGGGFVNTTVSGNLVASLSGTISADLDLRLKIGGTATTGGTGIVTLNNAFVGPLFSGNLFSVTESVNLTQSLPFVFSILHSPTVDVDYDDVIAMLQTGTLGATFPLAINENTSVSVPPTALNIQNLTGGGGGITINDLDIVGNLGGTIAATLTGTANLGADLLAQALAAGAANIQAQNTGPSVVSASGTGNPNYSITFSSLFSDADLAANQFISSYETLMFEFDLSPATLASQIGDGFLTGSTTPSQFSNANLLGTLSLTQLLSVFGGYGTFTAYANVKDDNGLLASLPFTVNVVPEPGTWLIWTGLAASVFFAHRRRTRARG